MSIHYADDQITLHHGKSLDVLRSMPDTSVDCCVTSPPYYGLRDYGTGTWEGGDIDCDHKKPLGNSPLNANFNERWGGSPGQRKQETAKAQSYRDICGSCGALRVDHQYGLEKTPAEYVANMRTLFAEVRRVLAKDGTLWLNLGDSYANGGGSGAPSASSGLWGNGHRGGGPKMHAPAAAGPKRSSDRLPEKNLLGIPWRVALALQDDGWILRNAIIWSKPNAMPESVTDRLSNRYEHLFLFSRSRRYWFDLDPIREGYSERVQDRQKYAGRDLVGSGWERNAQPGPHGNEAKGILGFGHGGMKEAGRNPGDVWEIATTPFPGAHFAVMPAELARRCIAAGCKPSGIVLDPFSGSGTTGLAANQLGHRYVGIDLNADYLADSLRTRFRQGSLIVGDQAWGL